MSGFDFRKMAADAKAAMAERDTETKSAAVKAKASREQYANIAVRPLREGVLPLLEKASKDFAEEGILSVIATEFDSARNSERDPYVKFQCKGPKRARDGWQFDARAIFFLSNGSRIRLGVADHPFSKKVDRIIAEDKTDNFAALVRIGLERAIEFYMEEYEKNRSQLNG